jgi:hypothetical protein
MMKLFHSFRLKQRPNVLPPVVIAARWKEQKKLNKAAGLRATPKEYTWHYVEDTKTKQLVPSDLHSAVGHSGGIAIIKYGR